MALFSYFQAKISKIISTLNSSIDFFYNMTSTRQEHITVEQHLVQRYICKNGVIFQINFRFQIFARPTSGQQGKNFKAMFTLDSSINFFYIMTSTRQGNITVEQCLVQRVAWPGIWRVILDPRSLLDPQVGNKVKTSKPCSL